MTVFGLIGGDGPLATMALQEAILTKAIDAGIASELKLLVDHDGTIVNTGHDIGKLRSTLALVAERLIKAGASILLTPVAAWHRPLQSIVSERSVSFLSMADVAKARVLALELSSVGILAGEREIEDGLYAETFASIGANSLVPTPQGRHIVDRCLEAVNSRFDTSRDLEDLFSVVESLRTAGAERIVIGTTELSLMMSQGGLSRGDIDAMDLLAEAAVEVLRQRTFHKPKPLWPGMKSELEKPDETPDMSVTVKNEDEIIATEKFAQVPDDETGTVDEPLISYDP